MDEQFEKLILQVQEGAKYRTIYPGLVRNIAQNELKKGRSWKETIKAVRNKLHQVGSAYHQQPIDFERLTSEMQSLPADIHSPEAKRFCIQAMSLHTSTRERLPILDSFYSETLASFAPVQSILDIACGLNPLALAWIPVSAKIQFTCCDIYLDQIEFLNNFFEYFNINGKAYCCDLTQKVPDEPAQVGLVLKTIPCLEQIDKNIALKLLEGLACEQLLVSFPAQSLAGRKKGMREFYSSQFEQLLQTTPWKSEMFSFQTEQAFLITK